MKQNITTSFAALIIVGLTSISLTAPAMADKLPKRSSDYNGNYQTLIKDQQAAPEVAKCIATARNLTKSSKQEYDRLGVTKDNVKNAQITKIVKNQTTKIIVKGEGRLRKSSKWNPVSVQCELKAGKVTELKLQKSK